jgi:alpha-tubulin suppressor-like RCC1 family protein
MNRIACKNFPQCFRRQHANFFRTNFGGPTKSQPKVTACGSGIFGALGRGDNLNDCDTYLPVNATFDTGTIGTPVSISAAWGHSAILTDRGRLLIFGRPYDFSILMQLNRLKAFAPNFARAIGKFTTYFTDVPNGLITTPQLVPNLDDVISCKCGAGLTVSLTRQGEVYTFGQNRWGQCGIGDEKR